MYCKGRKVVTRPKDSEWTTYKPIQKVGKLCYHYCSKRSHLPIRDVLNDHRHGFKVEPNYETATYNWCAKCNSTSVHAAIRDGLSHILFITRYTGSKDRYIGHYFIVGYYEIGWITKVDGRCAIRARKMCFVPIEHAYNVGPDEWKRINKAGKTDVLTNLRYATQRISGELLDEILQHLDNHDANKDYCREVERLEAERRRMRHFPCKGERA